jgi:hypothetical protein
MTIDIDNEIAEGTTAEKVEQDQSNPLHILQREIAAMPGVDAAKVQVVINKLQNGTLKILGTEEERLESAQRIAQLIIDESSD